MTTTNYAGRREDKYARAALIDLATGYTMMANAIEELAGADVGHVHARDALGQVQADLLSLTRRARDWAGVLVTHELLSDDDVASAYDAAQIGEKSHG